MLSRPRFPVRQQLRCQLPRTRMSLKCLFDRLEYERDLGLLPWTARAAQLFVPVHQGQQPIFSPLGPPRCHDQLRQVLTYRLPPDVDQSRYPCKLLLDLAQGVLFHRQPVGLEQRLNRLELGSQLLLHLLRRLTDRVHKPPGMQETRQIGQVLAPGTAHLLPVIDRGGTGYYPGLSLGDLGRSCLVILRQFLQALLGLFQVPFGLAQSTEDAKRIPLGQVMTQVKQVRDTRAAKPRVGQLDQRLGSVTHQGQHLGTKRRQTLVGTVEPGAITAIRCDLFHQQRARGQVHKHQHHPLQKSFIHGPNDRAYRAMGNAVLLPGGGGLHNQAFQRVHGVSQGTG